MDVVGAGASLRGASAAATVSDIDAAAASNVGTATADHSTGAGGELTGTRTAISSADDVATKRSLTRENESAATLASNGYNVQQNPPTLANGKNPDYIINGQVFDNYAPATSSVRNVASTIGDKVTSGQASNVVVNLTDSSVTPSQLQTQLKNFPIPGLQQLIVIDKTGAITVIKLIGP